MSGETIYFRAVGTVTIETLRIANCELQFSGGETISASNIAEAVKLRSDFELDT